MGDLSDFTPTTDEVRRGYAETIDALGGRDLGGAWFDRWLAQVRAEAWHEGYNAGFHNCADVADHLLDGGSVETVPGPTQNPYG